MEDMLTQDEINALLTGDKDDSSTLDSNVSVDDILDSSDKNLLVEIGMETMSTSKDILNTLLEQPVEIYSPEMSIIKLSEMKNYFEISCVAVKVDYLAGLEGMSILVLTVNDARVISDLMFRKELDPNAEVNNEPLTELELSTTGEAMNQMMGSASTVLAKMVGSKVDIGVPQVNRIDFSDFDISDFGFNEDINIFFNSYKMKIGEYVDSNLIQIFPIPFTKKLLSTVKEKGYAFKNGKVVENGVLKEKSTMAQQPQEEMPINFGEQEMPQNNVPMNNMQTNNMQMNNMQNQEIHTMTNNMGYGGNQEMMPQMQRQSNYNNINARNAEFQDLSFKELEQQKENINLVMDVPLEITVEMGRTNRTVKEILEFSPGTIIELDKLAGDPIDILVNGKFVAKGEVVVIDENYGIRITDIVSINNRI